MNKTNVKYNRYIRFAIHHLELVPEFSRDRTLPTVCHPQLILGLTWNHLYSVEFISDYLWINPLRGYRIIVRRPLRMIIDAAMQQNGTWNVQYLTLIANHPKLFFDIEHIITVAARHWRSNKENMIFLIDFFVDCDLVEWRDIIPILTRQFNATGKELYRTLRIHAYNQTLMKLAHRLFERSVWRVNSGVIFTNQTKFLWNDLIILACFIVFKWQH